jgi:hypothetical protein
MEREAQPAPKMGRSAHVPPPGNVDHPGMDHGLHTIADDLSETWIEDWAAVGLRELEALLAKHAAFLGYLDELTATELEPS